MKASVDFRRATASLVLAGLTVLGTSGCDVLATAPQPTPTAGPKATPPTQRATVDVKRGTIVDAIKVLGRVVSSQEADLSFRNTGRIREVYVQPGDLVQPGQVLAELDQRDLPWQLAKARVAVDTAEVRLAAAQARGAVVDDSSVDHLAIRSAEIELERARLGLEKLHAGALEQDVRGAEAGIAREQANLDKAHFDVRTRQAELVAKQAELVAKQQGPDPQEVSKAQSDLALARIKLERTRVGARQEDISAAQIALEQERTKLDRVREQPKQRPEELDNARVDVQKAQVALTRVLADIDAGVIRGEFNRDNAVRTAQLELQRAQNTHDRLAGAAPLPAEIRRQEQAVALAELELAKVLNQPTFDVQAAQVDVTAAQAKLDQLLGGTHEAELTAIKAQIRALELSVDGAESALAVAEAALAAARARLTLVTRGATPFELGDAQNKIALARNAIETQQARFRAKREAVGQSQAVAAFDLETLRRAIEQAQLDVQNFASQSTDVRIVAPFAGRITRLAGRPGDNVQAFFPVLNLSSLEGLVVKADIAEADLTRISAGVSVDLTMDAFTDQTLNGRVEALPVATVGQVGQAPERSTRISVSWPGPGAEMGMLARVQITLQVKPDVLMVPNGAVRTVGKRRFVEYMDGDIKRSRNVETGIVTDQDTEIVSGLQDGMVILAGQS